MNRTCNNVYDIHTKQNQINREHSSCQQMYIDNDRREHKMRLLPFFGFSAKDTFTTYYSMFISHIFVLLFVYTVAILI